MLTSFHAPTLPISQLVTAMRLDERIKPYPLTR